MAFWSIVLSVLLIVLAAAATLPPPVVAVPLVAAVLGAGLWLVATLWNPRPLDDGVGFTNP